jgi:hypothetical protein
MSDYSMRGYGRLLARLTTSEQFPAISAVIDSGAFDGPDDPDAEFSFTLARLLDGVGVLVDRRTAHLADTSLRSEYRVQALRERGRAGR